MEVGRVIGTKYRIDRVIGVGGMGLVVAATHLQLDQRVALKFMLPAARGSSTAVDRFLREGRSAAKLRNEHVCRVLDVGTLEDGAPYIVMEMLDGRDFAIVVQQQAPMPAQVAVDYVMQALEGVADAHANDIVHRDIKPSNLFVTLDTAGSPLVKVLDFGISKVVGAAHATATGDVVGSPAYMAPEQLTGGRVDTRADLWSLGVILYQAVTKRLPFEGDTVEEARESVTRSPPHPLPPELPAGFSEVVMRCLAKDAAARFATVAELALALAPFGSLESQARAARIGKIVGFGGVALGDTRTIAPPSVVGRASTLTGPAVIGIGSVITLGLVLLVIKLFGSSPEAAPTIRRGGTLHVAVGAGHDGFNLFSSEESRTRHALALVTEPLLHTDALAQIQPWLIDRHELRRADSAILLHLRDGVWFHDHPCLPGGVGRLATGDDVVYSMELEQKYGALELPIKDMTATGNDVVIHLATPTPFYAVQLRGIALVPRELAGCEDPRNMKQPVGTGPFRFAAPPRDIVLELVRAPRYWHKTADGNELPYLDRVSIEPITDTRYTLTRLAKGELELAVPHPDHWPDLVVLDRTPHLAPRFADLSVDVIAPVLEHTTAKSFGLFVGHSDGPLADLRVRRAVAIALDRDKLLQTSKLPFSGTSKRFLLPWMTGYDASLPTITRDVDAARTAIAAAAPSRPIRIGTVTQRPMAEEITRQLAEVGLRVEVVDVPPARIEHARETLDGMLLTMHWATPDTEPAELIPTLFQPHVSPRLTELQRTLIAADDRRERIPIYREIERALLDELPMIPIGWGDTSRPAEVFLVGRTVKGFYDPVTGYLPPDHGFTEVHLQ